MNLAAMSPLHHLRAGGVSVVLAVNDGLHVLYWGAELSARDAESVPLLADVALPQSGVDEPSPPGFWRESSRAHLGRPAISASRDSGNFAPRLEVISVERADERTHLTVIAADTRAGLEVRVEFDLHTSGTLRCSQRLTNTGSDELRLAEFLTFLPVPDRAKETLDFTGRWLRERSPQRREIATGSWIRESREGRPGHDATIMQFVLEPRTTFEVGEAWGIASAWSGNSVTVVERLSWGATAIAAGELLMPGEIILAPGATYAAPSVIAVYSPDGLDGASAMLHARARSRAGHPQRPRPLTLNVWEAVYFDHDAERLAKLVDTAADVGVERFVLDDGWFLGRRDDHAGLGDWTVDPDVWPEGLHEIARHVRSRGMEFGLWFEGEMVNLNSRLAREHPEWILRAPDRLPPEVRFQHTLDLVNPEAWRCVRDAVAAVIAEYDITYVKWDHNRFLVDALHNGTPAVREQTLAVYRLFDDLRTRFPLLEIESCASGGARIDLGMIDHVDRFWTSDTNDPLERQMIQRYTSLAIPPELLGTHIGPSPVHSTGRHFSVGFRAAVALFGHAGLEWDLTRASADELASVKNWSSLYRRTRGTLHTGRTVRDELTDGSAVHGVISPDLDHAVFAYLRLDSAVSAVPDHVRIRGLDRDAEYEVVIAPEMPPARAIQKHAPVWMSGARLSGRTLTEIGLPAPILMPGEALVIELIRRSDRED